MTCLRIKRYQHTMTIHALGSTNMSLLLSSDISFESYGPLKFSVQRGAKKESPTKKKIRISRASSVVSYRGTDRPHRYLTSVI